VPVIAYAVIDPWLGPPLGTVPPEALGRLVALHAVSVGGLMVVIGLSLRSSLAGAAQA
jgi:hypothetical protein